ncbi:hypothetical protein FHX82_004279 [Amycolatopsis bartoniae]|nr:XRE family transcriptional regulator [Amycolatopsis bartoniae]MBB2937215.1 hypothetical protein [Amycolatopsis bartoniae]
MSKTEVAKAAGYSLSSLTNALSSSRIPSLQLAQRLDAVLDSGGRLTRVVFEALLARLLKTVLLNAPARRGPLLGRRAARHRLDTAVLGRRAGEQALVNVVGPAGIGKTHLVHAWMEEAGKRFPGGALIVDLHSSMTPEELGPVLTRLLTALGIHASALAGQTPEELLRHFQRITSCKPVLLVLDNVDSLELFTALRPGTGSAVVLTSQLPLPLPGAEVVPLGPLDPPAARTLLSNLAGEARITEEPEATDRLLELCGGVPSNLRRAGKLLACKPELTIRGLVDTLEAERG